MSKYKSQKAVALKYDENSAAPIIVASGLGYMAEKIVEIATDNNLPVYEDSSLASVLTQLEVGTPIPPELYQAIVEIYVYFLNGCAMPSKPVAEKNPISANISAQMRQSETIPEPEQEQDSELFTEMVFDKL